MPRERTPRNELLYRARYNAGLTQGQLAKAVGVSRQMICQYERLHARPSPDTGQRIAYVLGLHTGLTLRVTDLFPDAEEAA